MTYKLEHKMFNSLHFKLFGVKFIYLGSLFTPEVKFNSYCVAWVVNLHLVFGIRFKLSNKRSLQPVHFVLLSMNQNLKIK
jgi:hypothetical protein